MVASRLYCDAVLKCSCLRKITWELKDTQISTCTEIFIGFGYETCVGQNQRNLTAVQPGCRFLPGQPLRYRWFPSLSKKKKEKWTRNSVTRTCPGKLKHCLVTDWIMALIRSCLILWNPSISARFESDRTADMQLVELNWIEKCLFKKAEYKYKEDIETIKAGFPKWTHRSIIHGL